MRAATALAVVPVVPLPPIYPQPAATSVIQAACAEIVRLDAVCAALPASVDPHLPVPADLTPAAARENPDLIGIDLKSVDACGSIHAHHVLPLIEANKIPGVEVIRETPDFTELRAYRVRRETPAVREKIARLEALTDAARAYWKANADDAAHDREVERISDAQIEQEIALIEARSADTADLLAKVRLYVSDPDRFGNAPTAAPMTLADSIMQDVLALFEHTTH